MDRKRRTSRRKCFFCESKTEPDYKQVEVLEKFVSDWAKIMPSHSTGLCRSHQSQLAQAIKRARHLALLPFVKR